MSIDYSAILEARARIAPWIHRTPLFTCRALNALTGARIFLKCENFQKAGAFKFRGASNAILLLSPAQAAAGVCTHSSGNHAQALALAASLQGIPARIVMPRNAPAVKAAAVRGYGGEITWCEPTLAAREAALAQLAAQTGAYEIHPYNNPAVIAGAGTAALELLEDVPDLEDILAPVGGGGLSSGTCLAAHGRNPAIRVYPAEPAQADDAFRSLQSGTIQPSLHPDTIADGLRTSLGTLTFPILRQHAEAILTVSESAILQAMRLLWERAKLVVEPSGCVPLAAVLEHPHLFHGRKVGLILSGGNVDLDRLPWQAAPAAA